MNFKRVLILSPHTDDGELGMGGTIARLSEEKIHIRYECFDAPIRHGYNLAEECCRSLKILGNIELNINKYPFRKFRHPEYVDNILQCLYDLNQKMEPDLVFLPNPNDHHQDHECITNEALRIFDQTTIYAYELPWNIRSFTEDVFVELTYEHVQKKLAALNQYASQLHRHYFNPESILSVVRSKGLHIGTRYAEAFQNIRTTLKIHNSIPSRAADFCEKDAQEEP